MTQLSPEDQPEGVGFVPADDDAAHAAFGEESLTNPAMVGLLFYKGLLDREHYLNALNNLSVPGRDDYWQDYRQAERIAADTSGIASGVNLAVGRDDVAYMKLLREGRMENSLRLDADVLVHGSILTLIRAPDGTWAVYSLGDYTRPEKLQLP